MAHVNHQSVCSVEPALWADSWQRVSAGVVRRAACRSEIPSMFAVRMRKGHSQRELSSTCIEPSDERMGTVAGRTARSLRSPRAAIGESNREPRRRSDEACVRRLTRATHNARSHLALSRFSSGRPAPALRCKRNPLHRAAPCTEVQADFPASAPPVRVAVARRDDAPAVCACVVAHAWLQEGRQC